MRKNELKETIEFVGLSYTKEILKIIAINIVILLSAFTLYFLLNNLIGAILTLIGLVIIDFFFLSRYSDNKKTLLKNRENELIAIISYFEVYVQNKNNVYQSFNMLLPYCSAWMKDKIEILLKEIDEDKTVQPFINFANNFQQLSTHSLMLSIYQMVDQGENTHQLKQFDIIFTELARNRNHEMMEQKQNKLANMSTFPLVGAGLITVTLTMSILSILGDLVNVL